MQHDFPLDLADPGGVRRATLAAFNSDGTRGHLTGRRAGRYPVREPRLTWPDAAGMLVVTGR